MNVESRTRIMEVIAPIGAGTQVVFKRHYRKLKNMQEPIDELLEWLHTFDDLQFTCNHRNVIEKIWQIKSKQQFAVSFVSNAEPSTRLYAFKITEMIHELKTWNEYFEEVFMGHKTFEIRKNDRDFKKGDTLILKEWDNFRETFTGRKLARTVTYVFEGGSFGLEKGFVVMAIQ